MANSIDDYFPSGNAPNLKIKNVEAPPADAARPEPEDLAKAVKPIIALLKNKKIAVITGAGISTDSGLPDYRSPGAPERNPMTIQQYMADEDYRTHYWGRNHIGWRHPFQAAPNAGHYALAHLEQRGIVTGVITQNIDMLHVVAGSKRVVHLHGRGDRVICTNCGHTMSRRQLHRMLTKLNPDWEGRHVKDVEITPDADAAITDTADFKMIDCPVCGGILRPDVVFFGGRVKPEDWEESRAIVDESDGLMVAGSTLAVSSVLRLVRRATRAGKPVAIINRGPTRADDIADNHVYAGTSRALPLLDRFL
jgi:NAD-dependent SIR2 family protein deacetylase